MKNTFLAISTLGALLLAGCVSTNTAVPSGSPEPLEASSTPQETSQQAGESEDISVAKDENGVEASSSGEAPPPSVQTGSTERALDTSASNLGLLIESLVVTAENPDGYNRDLFRHWVDADGDGCDTRDEVLIAESLTQVVIGSGCSLSGGEWFSAFDGAVATNSSSFDVDHFVPLKEAWDSGAFEWDSATRQSFANDLGYEMSLIAVSASSNRSKSDRDPADWLPPSFDYRCEYAVAWVQVKSRWSLSIDPKEKAALLGLADACGNEKLEYGPKANVTSTPTVSATPSPSPAPSPSKTATPTPTATATPTPTASQASSCQPGQVDINIASVEELMRIKHISDVRAPLVVSSRPYTSVDQLTRVKGIAAGRLADIKAEGIACVG
ncbi:MAG: DUF1524 domain-containing protein [Verrucomicrobia bacterium]|nr:DUF1524 domain-containing protein [Verrucomicrobiota bacterium]